MRQQPPLGLIGVVLLPVRRKLCGQRSDQRQRIGHPLRRSMLLLRLWLAKFVKVDPELNRGSWTHLIEEPVAKREGRGAVLVVVRAYGFEQPVVSGLKPGLVGND